MNGSLSDSEKQPHQILPVLWQTTEKHSENLQSDMHKRSLSNGSQRNEKKKDTQMLSWSEVMN